VYRSRGDSDFVQRKHNNISYYIIIIFCAHRSAATGAIFNEMQFGRTTRACVRACGCDEGQSKDVAGTVVVRGRRAKTFLPDDDDDDDYDDAAATTAPAERSA